MSMSENKITIFNTEPILNEINCVLKNGINNLLSDFIKRNDLLEKTHEAIMNLPSVKNELNKNYDVNITKIDNTEVEIPYKKDADFLLNIKEMISSLVKEEFQYIKKKQDELTQSLLDKILQTNKKLDENITELQTFKNSNKPEELLEEEKENIKLEIQESKSEVNSDDDEFTELDDKQEEPIILQEEVEEDEEEDEEEEEEVEEEEEELEEEEVEEEEVEEEEVEEEVEKVEEEEVEEVEVEEEEVEEEEKKVEEDEEELFEIEIDDITYCTNNEENGFIYELTEDGEVGKKVGFIKDGEPDFY